ncbi:hypothetical protein [Sphingobium sp.]|uniref:hypothetical protein n=1 Tax=Sphingobium sp. TaxID=1912891 RepID=UPI0028BD7DDC|nr:hypothetical protein [Sphingobium sp.]
MMGNMLRGSAAIAAILSGNALAQGHFPFGDGLRDGADRALQAPRLGDLPCPARRAMPRLCPRS